MHSNLPWGAVTIGMVAVLAICARSSQAQVTGVVSANGQVYFSSDSDTYNYAPAPLTNPGTGTTTVSGNALVGLPGAPAAGNPNPYTVANSFSFSPVPYVYSQSDALAGTQQTTAGIDVKADRHPALLQYVTAPRIQAFPFTGLHQNSAAPGYALEQFDFDAFYSVGTAGAAGNFKQVTANINGNLVDSGVITPFAEFGYQINYYEIVGSSTTYLGSASAYQFWNTAGPIVATVTGTPSFINAIPPSPVPVELEVTGDMFMAGDPATFDADVEDDIPEPAGLGLAAWTFLLLCRRRQAHGPDSPDAG